MQTTAQKIKIKRYVTLAAILLALAFLLATALFDWDSLNDYEGYNTGSLHYVRARVTQIYSESLTQDENDPKLYLGQQTISVEILEGDLKGTQVELVNYITKTHNVLVSSGERIIVCADTPADVEPYFTVYNHDRTLPLAALIAVFALTIILVARGKGLRALLGMGYSLLTVILFMVQAIYHGFSPVGTALITVLIAAGVCLLLLNGVSRRTLSGLLSTLAGVAVTAVLFALFSSILHLTGYQAEEAETLLMAGSATGLSLRWLLLAGVLVSALGAVMDVAVSLTASLEELAAVNPTMDRQALSRSGMNIGKDMMATMSNTLIFAFTGTALNTMLSLLAYGYQANQLLSSDYLAIELSQGLCATMGVVLTVPITAAVGSFLLRSEKFHSCQSGGSEGECLYKLKRAQQNEQNKNPLLKGKENV